MKTMGFAALAVGTTLALMLIVRPRSNPQPAVETPQAPSTLGISLGNGVVVQTSGLFEAIGRIL